MKSGKNKPSSTTPPLNREPFYIVNKSEDETELASIRPDPSTFDQVEKEILNLLKQEFFYPLLREIGAPKFTLQNSKEDLVRAIQSGQISFNRGSFTGKFNAAISRELKTLGAKWDRSEKAWKIHASQLPPEARAAIGASEDKFKRTIERLDQRLASFLPENISDKLKTEKIFDTSLWKLNRKFEGTIKGITVAPQLTNEMRKKIASEYTNDLKKYIKDWTEENILKLRKRVQQKAFEGFRYESLVKEIQANFGVAQSKAKFLARQETNLMLTKFKESRYLEAGVTEYIWHTVTGTPAHPVRPAHKKLAGRKFSWNDPPITSEDGRRNNPGQDFNCRCFARPVVKFK